MKYIVLFAGCLASCISLFSADATAAGGAGVARPTLAITTPRSSGTETTSVSPHPSIARIRADSASSLEASRTKAVSPGELDPATLSLREAGMAKRQKAALDAYYKTYKPAVDDAKLELKK
jgi:hypothetical protein